MTTMTVYPFRTSNFAMNIYIWGTTTFSAIPAEYVVPVEQYASINFTREQIDNALTKGYIDQEHYDATIAYITTA
jgi:hypothetical protein